MAIAPSMKTLIGKLNLQPSLSAKRHVVHILFRVTSIQTQSSNCCYHPNQKCKLHVVHIHIFIRLKYV